MVVQTRPETDRSPWWGRRRWGSPGHSPGGSPGNSSGGLPGTSPGGSAGGSLGGSPGGSVGNSPGGSQGHSPGRSPGGSDDGSCLVQVLGDSAFVIDVDGRMARSPTEYAVCMIEYLQQPEYELLHGQYVTSKSLEKEFYPRFLQATGWARMPWRTVGIALGRLA